jgi:hypothetical protein
MLYFYVIMSLLRRCFVISEQQNYLYIIFTSTHTGIGTVVKFITRNKYSHVSVSLDPRLEKMYSFTRFYENTPLIAGFSEESPLRYCSDSDEVTYVKICRIPISRETYDEISCYLERLARDSQEYLYNYFSLLLAPTGRRLYIPHAFTCLEFAVHLLSLFSISGISDNRYYSIIDLENILNDYRIYEGDMAAIAYPQGWGNDFYPERLEGKIKICTSSAKRVGRLIYRLLSA